MCTTDLRTMADEKKAISIFSDDGCQKFHDPVHGAMLFPEALVKIIQTTEFQRLRKIKHLGGTSFVFPGAVHTPYDHSLGTAFLCEQCLTSLQSREKGVVITDKNILCVQIAGLCHDLGRGPFSRVYKHEYLGKLKQIEWDQTEAAEKVFDLILEKKKIKKVFEKYGIGEEDIAFIKHCMEGRVPANPKEHHFLYNIVKNKRNGVDCNMFDMILRDCFFVGVSSKFDYARYFLNISINKVGNEYRICTRYKEKFELSELFRSQWALQHRVYRHKTTVAIERMLAEALAAAEEVFPEILDAARDAKMLLTLSDSIISRIKFTKDDRLAKSKEIINRITERRLYRFCGQTKNKNFTEDAEKREFCNQIAAAITARNDGQDENVLEEDIFIDIIDIKYGIGNGDPIQNTDFVSKFGKLVTSKSHKTPEEESSKPEYDSPPRDEKDRSALMDPLPKPSKIQYIRVYTRNEEKQETILARFYDWCNKNGYETSVDLEKIPKEHEENEETATKSEAVRKLEF